MPNRRKLLLLAAATSTAWAARRVRTRPLRILMIGGAGFVGSYHVRAALERGHEVTVFDHGNKTLPASVNLITGDRNQDVSVVTHRKWARKADIGGLASAAAHARLIS